ncbi:hypothetical protein IHE45_17G089200 [Dioscorea alata]|uniref:Uncharacterized protein n=1 Tax=Dioscorea alata TaxID=55571 RepID=A0ACB7UDY1_DIOAL|nr:hypothetical protein IHE45_17G089200 [Dioscorea alata]
MAGTMTDYANLSKDMFQEITKFLSFPDDYIRFGAVCSHWLAVAKEKCHSPWLLFFNFDSPKFFNPLEKKVYQIEIPELYERRCAGSSYGWLITINQHRNINLLNPFSKAQVKLPLLPLDDVWPIRMFDKLIYKAVISADPSKSSDYIVIAIYYSKNLAFWKPGDLTWTVIDNDCPIQDVIWYNKAFYVVRMDSKVCRVEFGINNRLIEIIFHDNYNLHMVKRYIVDFMGDLLLVYRIICPVDDNEYANSMTAMNMKFYSTKRFMLFKFDQEENQFIELKSLNGHILFLGSNHAMKDKTKNDIIYFSDDRIYVSDIYGYSDSGSYNIKDKSITPFPLHNIYHQAKPPIFTDVNLYPW